MVGASQADLTPRSQPCLWATRGHLHPFERLCLRQYCPLQGATPDPTSLHGKGGGSSADTLSPFTLQKAQTRHVAGFELATFDCSADVLLRSYPLTTRRWAKLILGSLAPVWPPTVILSLGHCSLDRALHCSPAPACTRHRTCTPPPCSPLRPLDSWLSLSPLARSRVYQGCMQFVWVMESPGARASCMHAHGHPAPMLGKMTRNDQGGALHCSKSEQLSK